MKTFLAGLNTFLKPRWLFATVFLLTICTLAIFPVYDFDVWLHLAVGRYMWLTRSIPTADIFSSTIFGKPWVVHEWLSQLTLYGTYRFGGIPGLILFRSMMTGMIFWCMLGSEKKRNILVEWAAYALVFIVMREWIRERPQLFSYLFCAWFFFVYRTENKMGILTIPLVQILWANMHGAVALTGIIISAVYLAFSRAVSFRLKIFIVASSCVGMFLNPHSYKIFSYLFEFYRLGFQTMIVEHMPVRFEPIYYPFFLLSMLTALVMILRRDKNIAEYTLIAGSFLSSIMAIRNIPVFAICAGPVIVNRLSMLLDQAGEEPVSGISRISSIPLNEQLRRGIDIVFKFSVAAILAAALWFAAHRINYSPFYHLAFNFRSPARFASRFIKECTREGFRGRIFNDYSFGGYLMWDLYPEHLVFVDGRLLEYGPGFIHQMSNYRKQPALFESWDRTYRFSAAVIELTGRYTSQFIDENKDWVLVYWDDTSAVYFKNITENRTFISRFGYHYLQPGNPQVHYLERFPRTQVLKEIDRSISIAPFAQRPCLLRKTLIEEWSTKTKTKSLDKSEISHEYR